MNDAQKIGITLNSKNDDLHIPSGDRRFRCAGFDSTRADDDALLESGAPRCCRAESNRAGPELPPASAPDAAVTSSLRPAGTGRRGGCRRRSSRMVAIPSPRVELNHKALAFSDGFIHSEVL